MSVLEIAKRAGVSAATVSRVLNNHPSVRPETLQQVRKVLAELNYARPTIRRGPRLGRRAGLRTGNVAVLGIGDTDHTRFQVPIFAAALTGIVQAARDVNLNVLIDDVPNPNHIPPLVRNREVDGAIVFLSAVSDAVLDGIDLLRRHMPIVRVMGDLPGATTVDHVGPDHAAVGHLAYEYLSRRNCKNLAFVSRQPTWDLNRTRAMGFAAAAHRDRLVPAFFVLSSDPIDIAAFGRQAQGCATDDELADRIVAARPDGLFTSRDDDVVHLYPLLRQRGIEPGRDITIVSCDHDDVRLSPLVPRPASIDLVPEEIGRRALVRLMGRIRKPDELPFRIVVVPRLEVTPDPAQPAEVGAA